MNNRQNRKTNIFQEKTHKTQQQEQHSPYNNFMNNLMKLNTFTSKNESINSLNQNARQFNSNASASRSLNESMQKQRETKSQNPLNTQFKTLTNGFNNSDQKQIQYQYQQNNQLRNSFQGRDYQTKIEQPVRPRVQQGDIANSINLNIQQPQIVANKQLDESDATNAHFGVRQFNIANNMNQQADKLRNQQIDLNSSNIYQINEFNNQQQQQINYIMNQLNIYRQNNHLFSLNDQQVIDLLIQDNQNQQINNANRLGQIQVQLTQLIEINDQLQQQNQQLNQQLQQQKSDNAKYQQYIFRQSQSQNQTIRNQTIKQNVVQFENQIANIGINELLADFQFLKNDLFQLEQSLQSSQQKVLDDQQQIATLQQENEHLKKKSNNMAENHQLQNQFMESQRVISELQNIQQQQKNEQISLQNQLQSSTSQVNSLLQTIQGLKQELNQYRGNQAIHNDLRNNEIDSLQNKNVNHNFKFNLESNNSGGGFMQNQSGGLFSNNRFQVSNNSNQQKKFIFQSNSKTGNADSNIQQFQCLRQSIDQRFNSRQGLAITKYMNTNK